MLAFPHGTLVPLESLIVQQVPLPYRYGICEYCVMGKWYMG